VLQQGLTFEISAPTPAVFGSGRSRSLAALLSERGWSSPAVVIDEAVAGTAAAADTLARLHAAFGEEMPVLHAATAREPDYDYLDRCADEFRDLKLDCLVGIGGGSAMDLCKGIAVLLTNPGRGIEYRGLDLVKRPAVPTVLLPTTAGTGSETTPTAVFVDRKTSTKLGINGVHVAPTLAVLDPDLTATCPHLVAVGSGLDAIVHALEAHMTCATHPFAHGIATQALGYLFDGFPAAVNEPEAESARLQMLLGAYLAGITLRYSGGGVMGALSYPLGAEFGIPHGLAGGLLIPHVVRLNVAAGYDGYGALERSLSANGVNTDPKETSRVFVERVSNLFDTIGAPSNFAEYPVTQSDIPQIVQETTSQRAAVLAANPAPADGAFLTEVLEAVIPA